MSLAILYFEPKVEFLGHTRIQSSVHIKNTRKIAPLTCWPLLSPNNSLLLQSVPSRCSCTCWFGWSSPCWKETVSEEKTWRWTLCQALTYTVQPETHGAVWPRALGRHQCLPGMSLLHHPGILYRSHCWWFGLDKLLSTFGYSELKLSVTGEP